MPTQVLGQNTNCTAVQFPPPQILTQKDLGTPSINSADFFYSNNPERISDPSQLADNNTYLLYERMFVAGQLYYWHQNGFADAIRSQITLFNGSTVPTIVAVSNYGVVPLGGSTGVDAWFGFYQPFTTTVTVPPLGRAALFDQRVNPGVIWGGIARFTINGSPPFVDMYDVAYRSVVYVGQRAPEIGTQQRGKGNGYFVTLNLNTFSVTAAAAAGGLGFTLGSPDDSFLGNDLVLVTDPDPLVGTNPLRGNYGAQYLITWPVMNDDSVDHDITLYGGNKNTGGDTGTNLVIDYMTPGGCSRPVQPDGTPWLVPGWYLPLIQDTITAGATASYTFQVATVGAFSYPLTLFLGIS